MSAITNNLSKESNLVSNSEPVEKYIKSKSLKPEIEAIWANRDKWMPNINSLDLGTRRSQYKFIAIKDGKLEVGLRNQKTEVVAFYNLKHNDVREVFYNAAHLEIGLQ